MISSRVKIVIDVRLIDSGGVGNYIVNILKALVSDGRFCIILLGNREQITAAGFQQSEYVTIIDFNFRIFSFHEQFYFLFKIPKDSDLFWSPQYNIPLLPNIPIVVTIHDLLHLKVLLPDFGFIKRLVSYIFFYGCSVKARFIFFNSLFTKSEFLSLFKFRVDRTIVTHLAVDQFLFQNTVFSKVVSFNYFLMIGNIKPHKNFEFAIRGFLEFSKNYDCKLMIIGRYENFITTSKPTLDLIDQNRDKIIFLGKISNFELIKHFEASLGLIFPSIYEGFGLPPLEAMSLGVPIVASYIPTTLETCGEELPFYFHLNDSVKYIDQLKNVFTLSEVERNILKNKMKSHVNKFSWDKCSKLTIDNFLKII